MHSLQVAASTNVLFQPTPYQLSAIFDIKSSIPSINPTYSAQNLAVTLRSMYPRPQVFILGIMIEEKTAAEAVQVWNEYVKEFSDPDGESKVQMIEEDRQKAESEIGAPPAVWEGLDKTLVINVSLSVSLSLRCPVGVSASNLIPSE